MGVRLLPQSYQYPNLSEGTDRVGGQQRGDKECPFSGVTKSGRVWRKVPESDARSVTRPTADVKPLHTYRQSVVAARFVTVRGHVLSQTKVTKLVSQI